MALSTAVVRDGNNAAQSVGALADLAGNLMPMHSLDSSQQFYRVSANFTPTATGAVTVMSVTGSATKTIRIRRITVGGVSTAVSGSIFQLIRTSVLGAGGTTVSPTVAKLDTNSATATALVSHYTSTLKATGTAVGGPITTRYVGTNVVTTPATVYCDSNVVMFPEGGAPIGQAIVLRGTSDILELQNVTPANLGAGTVLSYTVEWIEDAS
jgi:hypothetical protein